MSEIRACAAGLITRILLGALLASLLLVGGPGAAPRQALSAGPAGAWAWGSNYYG